jgi:hypothetical protein
MGALLLKIVPKVGFKSLEISVGAFGTFFDNGIIHLMV